MTALHLATMGNRVALVQQLLAAGADPNAADLAGRTALHQAAAKGLSTACHILLEHGARPDALDRSSRTPASLARGSSHASVAAVLESGGWGRDETRSHTLKICFCWFSPPSDRKSACCQLGVQYRW